MRTFTKPGYPDRRTSSAREATALKAAGYTERKQKQRSRGGQFAPQKNDDNPTPNNPTPEVTDGDEQERR